MMKFAIFFFVISLPVYPSSLPDVIATNYGAYTEQYNGWLPAKAIDPELLQRFYSVCLDENGLVSGQIMRFLALCAYPHPGETGSHVDSGLVDLYVITDAGTINGKELGFYTGSWGIPGKIQLVKVGPNDHAFSISSDYTGMGQSHYWHHMLAPTSNRLVELATLSDMYDSMGLSFCDSELREEILSDYKSRDIVVDENCYDVSYQVDFMPNVNGSKYFNLLVLESGLINGRPTNRKWEIPFDASTNRYLIPKELATIQCAR